MKKILAISFLFAVLAACSSDDKPKMINYPIAQNITAKWFLSGYDSGSGYVEYNNLCEEKKDFLEFTDNGRSYEQAFDEDCETSYSVNASWIVNDVYLSLDNDEDEVGKYYKILVLNDSTLILEEEITTTVGAKLKTAFYYSR